MKILHVIASVFKQGGGTSEVVPRLARAQKEQGHEVTIAAIRADEISEAAQEAVAAGVINEAKYERSGFWPHAIAYSNGLREALKRLVGEADIVHLHGLWMYPCWAAAWEAQRQGKPYLVMPHGFLNPERLKISKWKKRIIGQLIEKSILRKSSGAVATAPSEVVSIRAYGYDGSVHVMPIGLDCERFSMRASGEKEKKTLLYFSRISPIKGLDMLAEAWGSLATKDWRLLIVGPDDRGYTEEMKRLFAAKCEAGSFEFRGPVFGEEKFDLLASADAFVLPTRNENWSIAVAEAMASGLPVICTKGAPWECLETARAGWWCEISIEGLKGALCELIASDGSTLIEKGRNAKAWVEQNLSWNRISAELVDFYKETL